MKSSANEGSARFQKQGSHATATSPRLAPLPGEVHLWRLRHKAEFSDENSLSDEERERAVRYRFAKDRARYRFTQSRKREILASYLDNDPRQLAFTTGSHGKPALPELAFSISHTEGFSLLAVASDEPLGIDVEALVPVENLPGLANRILTASELIPFEKLSEADRQGAFLKIWTAKEATLKALGCGLHIEPNAVRTNFPELSQAQIRDHATFLLTEIEVNGAVAHLASLHQPTIREQAD